jgi:hypothetical protein
MDKLIDYRTLARREVSRVLQIAVRAIDKALSAPPQRQAVLYRGCSEPVNTHNRYLKAKGK